MRTLIVYYSMGGNTDYAARRIAQETGAELLRLEPQKAYPDKGFKKFFWGGKSAVMAETPPLMPYAFDAGAYDRVVFGFPVWASNVAPPIRTFVKENGPALGCMHIAAFACQGGSGGEKALAKLKSALGRGALEAEAVLIDPKDRPGGESEEKLAAFCGALEEEL